VPRSASRRPKAGAAKLSDGLAAAAQRFEGVDRSLADTLSALSGALDEFRRRIQEFVAGTDQNLAKAAGHISTLVSELNETLDGHPPRPQ
jgi:ABC-type transporter Mla subunit MlaD